VEDWIVEPEKALALGTKIMRASTWIYVNNSTLQELSFCSWPLSADGFTKKVTLYEILQIG